MPTFVVEDGTGLSNANAYADVSTVDAYHEDYGDPADWTAASTPAKQDAIRQATRYLDVAYSQRWRGDRKSKDQRLDWPRIAVVDSDDWTRDDDVIPYEVVSATSLMALKVVQGEILLPDITGSDAGIVAESVGVGPIRESKTYASTKSNFKRFSLVDGVLRPLLVRGGSRERA